MNPISVGSFIPAGDSVNEQTRSREDFPSSVESPFSTNQIPRVFETQTFGNWLITSYSTKKLCIGINTPFVGRTVGYCKR